MAVWQYNISATTDKKKKKRNDPVSNELPS